MVSFLSCHFEYVKIPRNCLMTDSYWISYTFKDNFFLVKVISRQLTNIIAHRLAKVLHLCLVYRYFQIPLSYIFWIQVKPLWRNASCQIVLRRWGCWVLAFKEFSGELGFLLNTGSQYFDRWYLKMGTSSSTQASERRRCLSWGFRNE